jgi:ribulose-5-phosphate 4-epimerase/fuculose-1-phosphate aldolase
MMPRSMMRLSENAVGQSPGGAAPPSEAARHLGVDERHRAGGVVHTHAPLATALLCVLEEIRVSLGLGHPEAARLGCATAALVAGGLGSDHGRFGLADVQQLAAAGAAR